MLRRIEKAPIRLPMLAGSTPIGQVEAAGLIRHTFRAAQRAAVRLGAVEKLGFPL